MTGSIDVTFKLNGADASASVPAETLLVDFLRDTMGTRSVKRSCDMQVCGACTVLVDGRPVSSCTMLAADIDGTDVITVEGMSEDGKLHPLQAAFIEKDALQCGFCTPGMLLAAKALLDTTPQPSREEIIRSLDGNICRCTGYKKIIEAIEHASRC